MNPLSTRTRHSRAPARSIGSHSDRNENGIRYDRLLLPAAWIDAHGDGSVGCFRIRAPWSLENLRPVFDVVPLHDGGEVRIDPREERRKRFDTVRFAPEALVDASQFHADDAASDDKQTLWDLAQTDGLFGSDDLLPVELKRGDLDGR